MTVDPNAWLMGSGAPSAKFDTPGDTVTGRIVATPELRQQTDFTSGKPLFWDNGDPRMQLVVTLQTEQHDPSIADDDGTRRVYVKGQLQKAVQQAVRQAGAPGLEVGGTLTVTYTGDGEVKQRGMNPPKLYTATYKAAAASFLDQQQPAEQSPAAPAVPPAAASLLDQQQPAEQSPAAPAVPPAAPAAVPAAAAANVGQMTDEQKQALIAQLMAS